MSSNAGCEKIFSDKISGAKAKRPGLEQALDFARKGDTLVVWKLDRLGRSLKHLIETVNELNARGIGFKSLQEGMDTSSAGGRPKAMDEETLRLASALMRDPAISIKDICKQLGVSRSTLYRYLRPDGSRRQKAVQSISDDKFVDLGEF